jgi:hypothetical protein
MSTTSRVMAKPITPSLNPSILLLSSVALDLDGVSPAATDPPMGRFGTLPGSKHFASCSGFCVCPRRSGPDETTKRGFRTARNTWLGCAPRDSPAVRADRAERRRPHARLSHRPDRRTTKARWKCEPAIPAERCLHHVGNVWANEAFLGRLKRRGRASSIRIIRSSSAGRDHR